jgi:hypothetical protein
MVCCDPYFHALGEPNQRNREHTLMLGQGLGRMPVPDQIIGYNYALRRSLTGSRMIYRST